MTAAINVPRPSAQSGQPTSVAELSVAFGGCSIAGNKPQNEDAFAAHQPTVGIRQLKGSAACIADGVSCSEHAQQASQTAVTHFIDDYYSTPDSWTVKTSAARVLSALNAWLYHHGKQNSVPQNGMVTTFSAAIFKSRTAHLFHMGDSRIYRLRGRELEQLTTDHSMKGWGEQDFLARALGMDNHLEVDYLQEELEQGDLFMLTTDGTHDVLPRSQLLSLLQAPATNLEEKATTIVNRALTQGSRDNISCLLLSIEQLPLENIDEIHRKITRLAIPPVMEPGMSIDGYRVRRVIHSGPRSHLYLVTHPERDKQLVLKAPSANFSEDTQYLEGFLREEWVGRRIDSPGVMKIYGRDDSGQFLYHLCEYIEGQTLRQWMYDNPQPSLDRVRAITGELIQSLRAFQRLGMVHRDLKPENVMINANGQIKLIDFGTVQVSGLSEIASPLSEECPVGSVDYIAPEYLLQQPGSFRSDLFSLGVMVYEMLAGQLPFNMSNSHRRTPAQFSEWRYTPARKPRPELPPWLDLALEKAMNPNPVGRYPALSEFYADLCTPNQALVDKREKAPLLERNPLQFWKIVSAVLLLIILLQAAL